MPTYTAVSLDRLLEPDAPKSTTATMSTPIPRPEPRRLDRVADGTFSRAERGASVPPRLGKRTSLPILKSDKKNDMPDVPVERNYHWAKISPALYATPKSTPIPDSPSSFPPSPYVINHKRRGPRLLKSYSEQDVATGQRDLDEKNVNRHENNSETKVPTADDSSILRGVDGSASAPTPAGSTPVPTKEENRSSDSVQELHADGSLNPDNQMKETYNLANQGNVNGKCDKDPSAHEIINDSADQISSGKTVSFKFQGEIDEFWDRQDSVSVKSYTEIDAVFGSDQSTNLATPLAEFYDAWDELSSENGPQQQPEPVPDIQAELRGIRLSLLMEIEKRKEAEEAFNTMHIKWENFRSQLSSVGLTLPADPLAVTENMQLEASIEELRQQIHLARSVSNSIGRGMAKAEVEMEMEAQLEYKNFEIARLSDRLRYYEAVNREMSQRNQEAVDNSRKLRQRRKRRQKWVWGSVAAAITIGSAVLAWSYVPTDKGTRSSQSHASEGDRASQC